MPIEFRCTGCRSKLHVPRRWAGNTLPCPKCGTRVVVPPAAQRHEPTPFEDTGVEKSLAALDASRVAAAGGIFAEDDFELPSADRGGVHPGAGMAREGITLSRRAIYAYVLLVPLVAAVAFRLGCWWASPSGR